MRTMRLPGYEPAETGERERRRPYAAAALGSRVLLWGAFAVVHAVLAASVLSGDGRRLGDVLTTYLTWASRAVDEHHVVGVDSPWVYPVGALVPVLLPMLLGALRYGLLWVIMATAIDAAAIAVLTVRRDADRWRAAWWWLGFLLLLGPISLVRLDTVSVAIAIVALVWLATRPRVAVMLLTFAAWIKVWPVALLVSLLLGARHRLRTIAISLVTSAAIIAVPVALGAGRYLFSFVGTQDARGLQIESPVATAWLWAAAMHEHPSHVFYSRALNTFEVSGPGTTVAAQLMTPLLLLTLVVVMGLGALAAVRRDEAALPALMLATVLTLMLFDKVLSPQYVTWLAAPIVHGLIQQPRAFRFPALLAFAAAGLTQAFYPWIYDLVIAADPAAIALLAVRNLSLVVLFGWAVARLCRRRVRMSDATRGSALVATPSLPAAGER